MGSGCTQLTSKHKETHKVAQRQTVVDLGQADEVDRQKPGRQRQLGVLHQAASRQRSRVSEPVAREQLALDVTDGRVPGQRAASTGSAHCIPVRRCDGAQGSTCRAGTGCAGWQWGALRCQKNTGYDLTSSANEPSQAGSNRFLP